jgi:hypothetical protein
MSDKKCIMCNSSDAKLCGLCKSISYCSQKCQKDDWPLHKKICKSFTTIPTRPSPSHKLSILFPVNSKNPQLVWVKCTEHKRDDDSLSWESPETQNLLGLEDLDPKSRLEIESKKIITRSILRGFELGYTVEIFSRDTFLYDGSTPNICVQHTTEGQTRYDWRGPFVVMRRPSTAMNNHLVYEDTKAGDLRVAVDYFLSYG